MQVPSLINRSIVDSNTVSNTLSIATKLFDQHPNIINIVLNLKKPSSTEAEKVINNLSIVKIVQKMTLEQKWLKWKNHTFASFITEDFNNCVDTGIFTDYLKHAGVTPVHKKKGKNDKTNYTSVSILPNIFKNTYTSKNIWKINL